MTIKLIALDLDGTTLNKSGRLSARTKAALEEAIRGRGIGSRDCEVSGNRL